MLLFNYSIDEKVGLNAVLTPVGGLLDSYEYLPAVDGKMLYPNEGFSFNYLLSHVII